MSNLTLQKIDQLPVGLQKFAGLRVGHPSFKSLSINEQKRACLAIVTRAHAANGTKGTEESVLVFQTMELVSCLSEKYGELTVKEIEQAFENGIAGETGPYMGLYKKTYYQFLKHFYERPERSQAMKQYLDLNEAPVKKELSPEEKRQKSKEAAIYFFNEYKTNKVIPAGSFGVYQFLLDEGFIKWTKEQKNEISAPIKEQYKKEVEKSYKRGIIRKVDYETVLGSLESNPTLIGRVRKEALKKYFSHLIDKGIELEKEINIP